MDACLDVLSTGLGDEAKAHRAYAAIQTYTIGFAALEAAREAASAAALERAVPAEVRRAKKESAERELAGYASPAQFRAALEYLMTGVESS